MPSSAGAGHKTKRTEKGEASASPFCMDAQSHASKKENPAEPCTPQKKTLHSKAVSAALLCASNIRCGRAAREACIPTERYRIPFKSCRFRYGRVSQTKQDKSVENRGFRLLQGRSLACAQPRRPLRSKKVCRAAFFTEFHFIVRLSAPMRLTLLSVYACARDLCAQFSLLSPSASSS